MDSSAPSAPAAGAPDPAGAADPADAARAAGAPDPAGAADPADAARAPADQTDRVILESARAELGPLGGGDVVVLDDATGALTAAALEGAAGAGVRVLVRESSAQRALALAAEHADARREGRLMIAGIDGAPADLAGLLAGSAPHLALARLPKALDALEALAREVARAGVPALVAGGRVKHMTRTQNDVLARAFADVHATRGIGKSRALVARGPLGEVQPAAVHEGGADVMIRGAAQRIPLRAVGGVFGGAAADAGSLLLVRALDETLTSGEITAGEDETAIGGDANADGGDANLVGGDANAVGGDAEGAAACAVRRAVDLGCGNGLLAAYLHRALPGADVLATDDDLDAVASTRETLRAMGDAADGDVERTGSAGEPGGTGAAGAPGVRVLWEASLAAQAPQSADLVLLNPPFHDGTAVDATLVQGLLDAAARVLRPGGQLWFVHNSHLRYRSEVERRVGSVDQRARDRRFTVLRATRR